MLKSTNNLTTTELKRAAQQIIDQKLLSHLGPELARELKARRDAVQDEIGRREPESEKA